MSLTGSQALKIVADCDMIQPVTSGAKPSFASTTAGLAVGVTAAVVLACAGGAYLYSKHHMQSLLETARATAVAEGDLIRVALEHQMIENDRTLIAKMMDSFRKQSWVERLVLLDRAGAERELGLPPDQAGSSRVLETRQGQVLRTVVPIRNRPECYGCHDSGHKVNGILILDYRTAELAEEMSHDLRWMVVGTATMTLLLLGAIGVVIRVAVLRRLQRFETTARQIAGGDLAQRVPAAGGDTISWLAREFNTMADSVTGLLTEVHDQRERLEKVINSIDDGIVVLDAHRRVIAANDAFLERARHSREEVLGCQCRDLTPGGCTVDDCPTLTCLRGGARQVRLCERRTPEGKVLWEEVHASPILDSQRKLLQVVEVWRDISDRRAAEARMAEAHRLASLGTLASGFSHELNTPLATVLTCVEGILKETAEGGGDPAWIRDSASIAREQILRCRGITQHFLRLSRGQRGNGELVDLGPVITAVVRLIEPTARAHSVKVALREIPLGMHVRGDEAELQHTLINLLLNAVQTSKPGGQVRVEAEAGAQMRVRIIDEGCGIAVEDQKRIFEPFFSARPGGTGLGLFLALNFVKRWGGEIRVESTVGRGSTFEVVLPALVTA
jgi:two-component system CheB/CheR fusion protein